MSNIDKRALREAADAANKSSWGRWESYHPHKGARGYEVKVGVKAVAQHCLKVDSVFIAAANPATVLALLDELEAAEKRIAEQREYYEGVIADGSRRIAELEAREIKPAKGEVLVVVSGFTGCGKSAIAGEIEIAMKAIGVPVRWTNGDAEKRMTGADWLTAIEMYKPTLRIVEVNVPRAAGIGVKG
ncbi:ead/Ea22-like family protein [Citrobacter freundii]|uniref:ead/Ea22-like family protein n=1 Tax=Citrobacter freundii TaxID=546 RepID=UPI0015EAF1E8|nr:ead/Ea22-like family protein [Citrobacter freundii]QLR51841.1 ead/Ea22-like family protein [Citrobacter freundii]